MRIHHDVVKKIAIDGGCSRLFDNGPVIGTARGKFEPVVINSCTALNSGNQQTRIDEISRTFLRRSGRAIPRRSRNITRRHAYTHAHTHISFNCDACICEISSKYIDDGDVRTLVRLLALFSGQVLRAIVCIYTRVSRWKTARKKTCCALGLSGQP